MPRPLGGEAGAGCSALCVVGKGSGVQSLLRGHACSCEGGDREEGGVDIGMCPPPPPLPTFMGVVACHVCQNLRRASLCPRFLLPSLQECAEELFEVLACYFPVTFNPPPGDPSR